MLIIDNVNINVDNNDNNDDNNDNNDNNDNMFINTDADTNANSVSYIIVYARLHHDFHYY